MADGVCLAVRLTPRGGGDQIVGLARLADGAPVLRIAVSAPPADGRANAALLALLAREWQLPRRALAILGGLKSRRKTVHIAGDPVALGRQIADRLAALPRA